ncbi:hypothetical protein V8G54_035638 [Vigna mungo]|uniref:Uncharacterized protein n=1 Tax=Vigna mungo TaxID=3915 RepID=A0AAQ3MFN6_VIGMU
MRCCGNILSLIVKDGLKEIKDSISKIRSAVKSSPARFARFKAYVEQEGISYKGIVCLDVETRWNSTYLMLETSLKYKDAFVFLNMQDKKFGDEMAKSNGGVPLEEDWEYARSILPFLKMFYDSTLRISGSSYVSSHMYMKEVFEIGKRIRQYSESNDVSIKLMAMRMKGKYEKYWGNPNGINILLLIVVVLDPRSKLDFVNYFIDYLFESSMATELKSKLLSSLKTLYEQYQGIEEGSQSSQQESQLDDDDNDPYCMRFYLRATGRTFDYISELDKYLREDLEPYMKSVELDILHWWKVNSTRFPILANMARQVLAIPISTVASECAFSNGGRVVSPYRNWLKGTPFSILFDEDPKELDKFEQDDKAGTTENKTSKEETSSKDSPARPRAASGPAAGFPNNPFDFSGMAGLLNRLGNALMQDPSMSVMLENFANPSNKDQLEERMARIKEDPSLKHFLEAIETGGPAAMTSGSLYFRYWNDENVLRKLGQAMGLAN